jgi:hypothetical protein
MPHINRQIGIERIKPFTVMKHGNKPDGTDFPDKASLLNFIKDISGLSRAEQNEKLLKCSGSGLKKVYEGIIGMNDKALLARFIEKRGGIEYFSLELEQAITGQAHFQNVLNNEERLDSIINDFDGFYNSKKDMAVKEKALLIDKWLFNDVVFPGLLTKDEKDKIQNGVMVKSAHDKIIRTLEHAGSRQLLDKLFKISCISEYLFKSKNIHYKLGNSLCDLLTRGYSDCDKVSTLMLKLGNKVGLSMVPLKLLGHVTVFVNIPGITNNGVALESTSGQIYDIKRYNFNEEKRTNEMPESDQMSIIATYLTEHAISAHQRQDLVEAEKYCNLALQFGKDMLAYQILGHVNVDRGKIDLAKQYYMKSLSITPSSFTTLASLFNISTDSERTEMLNGLYKRDYGECWAFINESFDGSGIRRLYKLGGLNANIKSYISNLAEEKYGLYLDRSKKPPSDNEMVVKLNTLYKKDYNQCWEEIADKFDKYKHLYTNNTLLPNIKSFMKNYAQDQFGLDLDEKSEKGSLKYIDKMNKTIEQQIKEIQDPGTIGGQRKIL